MRILKDNFKSNQPISSVGCEWFNTVAKFINKLTGSRGVVVDRSSDFPKVSLIAPTSAPTVDKVLTIKDGEMDPTWEDSPGTTELGTPSACGSFHTTEVTQTAETLWEIGGDNGATILVLFKGSSAGTYTYLYGAKLTFSKAGILTKIEAVENCGEKIAG